MASKKANLIENVIVGEYGYPVFLHLVDENNDDVNLTSYDILQVLLRTPDDLKTVTYTATLFSDGTDGKIYFTPATTDLDRAGTWKGMVKLTDTGVNVTKSQPFDMEVLSTL
jgi:hypothetical protein